MITVPRRRVLFALFAAAAAASVRPAGAGTFDIVAKVQDSAASTVWRIEQPDVRRRQVFYPQIPLRAGDVVNVAAGGCVQTGGAGRTWKRYVDPAGPGSNRLYHGLIDIPGITNGLVRLQRFGLGIDHAIPNPLPPGVAASTPVLSLGYEDDRYGDNGYDKHDDGTGGQCINSVNAFVVLSISHDGALPPNAASFVGITPDRFRCQAAWAFHNFKTPSLSWSSFTDAFNLSVADYLDPLTYVTFAFGRKLAAGGNCAGMSLLAVVGEDQFTVRDLEENFWNNYKDPAVQHPELQRDINVAHWAQLSSFFLRHWLAGYGGAPEDAATAAERDLTKPGYNYGLLSLAHGLSGHVLVPLRVSRTADQVLIDVYDPNRPCTGPADGASNPKIVIAKGRWSS